jgi:hypothetical protein
MLVGCFMCLEVEYAFGNVGQSAGWEAMNFVVEAGAFKQKAGCS